MKTLVFLEKRDEIGLLEKTINSGIDDLSNLVIIALSLEVQCGLRKKQIPYKNTIEFFNNKSHADCLLHSASVGQQIEEECRYSIDEREYFGLSDWLSSRVKWSSVNYVISLIEIVNSAIETYAPKRLWVIDHNSDFVGGLLTDDDYYHGAVARRVAETKSIPVISIGRTEKKEIEHNNKEKKTIESRHRKEETFSWIDKRDSYLIITSLGYNMKRVLRHVKKHHPMIKVLMLRLEEDVVEVSKENTGWVGRLNEVKKHIRLRLSGIYKVIDLESLPGKIYDGKVDRLKIDNILPTLKPMFVYKGINYSDIVEKKITNGVIPSVEKMAENAVVLNELFERVNPKLVMSVASRGISYLIGEICRYSGIEGICIPHGTPTRAKNQYEEIVSEEIARVICLNKYPTVAVQTREAEKFFEENPSVSRKLVTGPLVLSRTTKKASRSPPITYLHASTLKTRESEKFWGVERHDEFVQSVNDIVSAVRIQPDARLRIKLHPAAQTILDDVEWKEILGIGGRVELGRFSLEKELDLSDILISYSSTSIEEALICRKPVILYDKWKRYRHLESLDPKTVGIKPFPLYYIDDYDVLCDSLPKISDPKNLSMINQWDRFVYIDEKQHNFTKYINTILS